MSTRLMRPGLSHPSMFATDEQFFKMIDDTGGWPAGYKYAGFEHTDERLAGFTNSCVNSGWWTVVVNEDDYYLWKLSPEKLKRLMDDAVTHFLRSISPNINPESVFHRGSDGRKATIQGAQK